MKMAASEAENDVDKENENENVVLVMSEASNNVPEVSNCLHYNITLHIHDIYSIIMNL